jgi:hypothetical protein
MGDTWARKHLSDFLRNVGDEETIVAMIDYILQIQKREQCSTELHSILGIAHTGTMEEARKLDFIDEYLYKKYGGVKPKKHKVKM